MGVFAWIAVICFGIAAFGWKIPKIDLHLGWVGMIFLTLALFLEI